MAGIRPRAIEPAGRGIAVSDDRRFDGGSLRRSTFVHRHVLEHEDGRVSAIVIRGVPAPACEICEAVFYEPEVTDTVAAILQRTREAPGEAVALDYHEVDAS